MGGQDIEETLGQLRKTALQYSDWHPENQIYEVRKVTYTTVFEGSFNKNCKLA